MNDKNLCYSCARGKVCRENPAFPCKECSCYVAEQKWISVKDRLPVVGQEVLCFCAGNLANVYTWTGEEWEDSYGYYEDDDIITHWMPLPEPPATMSTKSE